MNLFVEKSDLSAKRILASFQLISEVCFFYLVILY